MIRTTPREDLNPDWAARGKVCRDRRVNGGQYRTQRDQARLFGLRAVELSKMENGRMDPGPLEAKWREVNQ